MRSTHCSAIFSDLRSNEAQHLTRLVSLLLGLCAGIPAAGVFRCAISTTYFIGYHGCDVLIPTFNGRPPMYLPVRHLIFYASLSLLTYLVIGQTAASSEARTEQLTAPAALKAFQPDFNPLPDGQDTALVIADAGNGDILYSRREEQYQPPASIQKVVTALAALLYLGKDYRFTTQLEQQDNNVVLRFSGDPSLSRQELAALLATLKTHSRGQRFQGICCSTAASSAVTSRHRAGRGIFWASVTARHRAA